MPASQFDHDGSVLRRLKAGEGRRLSTAYCEKCGRAVASLHVLDGSRWLLTSGGRFGSARLKARDLQTAAWNMEVEAAHPRQQGDDVVIERMLRSSEEAGPAELPWSAYHVEWVSQEMLSRAEVAGSHVEYPAVCPGCRQIRAARMAGVYEVAAVPWPYEIG